VLAAIVGWPKGHCYTHLRPAGGQDLGKGHNRLQSSRAETASIKDARLDRRYLAIPKWLHDN
jgi:hypothetical protein